MKKIVNYVGSLVSIVSLVAFSGPALAANTNGNKLLCFDGTTDGGFYGLCSLAPDGTATLDNVSNDATGVTNPYDQYSGVYLQNSNLDGKKLSAVNQLAFDYTGVPTAGSPRLTLPIDKNGDGVTDVYASIGAYYCNDGAGHVDAINDLSCQIFLNDNSAGPWANWDAFVAANPTWKIGKNLPFIIADDPGTWTVSNVQLGKGPARATK